MRFSTGFLEKITYIYIAIPFVMFLAGWLNPFFACLSILVLSYILFRLLKETDNNDEIFINKTNLTAVIVICLLWCIFAGIGGFYYQNLPDWNMKNAIIHDLIDFSWPVVYDNNVPLTYYFGFMLPAAFVGKIVKFLGASYFLYNLICNIALLVWSIIGVVITFLWVTVLTGAKDNKIFWALLIFIFFSGMDIIIPHEIIQEIPLHIEWHEIFEYSSNMTLLSFVFNQAIVSWLLTCLLVQQTKNVSKFGIWGTFTLFYAPLPFIGFLIYYITIAIWEFFASIKNLKQYFLRVFDVKNILSVFILLPILYFFYKSNNTASDKWLFLPITMSIFKFIMAEAMVLIFFIWHKYYKNILLYIMVFYLIVCPFVYIQYNDSHDFCMRVSVPSLFILMIFCIKFLFSKIENEGFLYRITYWGVIVCLLIGSVTPIIEFYRGFYVAKVHNDTSTIQDKVKTLNNKIKLNAKWIDEVGSYKNYGCFEPDKSIFWKYIASKRNFN